MADTEDRPKTLDDIHDLDGYMECYGKVLATKIEDQFRPLHVPGVDPIHPLISTLNKPFFPAQEHFITACVRCLNLQKSVFGVGEMGVGKTVLALGIAHCHSEGKPYRSILMVPDHLQKKWKRHVEAWVPGARAIILDGWKAWSNLADEWQTYPKNKRPEPTCPEWYILGRDASKFDPSWVPKYMTRKRRIEQFGNPIIDVMCCPKCGMEIMNKGREKSISLEKLANTKYECEAPTYTWDEDKRANVESGTCGEPLWGWIGTRDRRRSEHYRAACATATRVQEIKARGISKDYSEHQRDDDARRAAREFWDGQPDRLGSGFFRDGWNHQKSIPWRFAPARTIHKRLKGFFDYVIIDEVHEEKSATAAQANAAGKLIASAKKAIALTGTILGGYAWHVFPITYRLCPDSLKNDSIEWGQQMLFSERYGRVDEIIMTQNKQSEKGGSNSASMGGKEKVTRRKVARPGIMPTLYGNHMISNSVFMGLEEVSEGLPPRPIDELRQTAMDDDIAETYRYIEQRIKETIAPMIVRGDTSLLGRMLQTLLAFTDHPWGWAESGYLEPFGIYKLPEFAKDRIYPKERDLIDFCLSEKADGRKTWVFAQMTGKRDVLDRLVKLMKSQGLHAATMRSDVERVDREDWIIANAPKLDVMISHPELVKTGLDLFYFDPETGEGHNFPSIYWYQTGYNLFTLRQASRRAWRIGQPELCRSVYAFYEGTMQERAMELIGKKLAAAEAIDGKFSAEGLAALAGDDSLELQLARSLASKIEGASRSWSRLTTAGVWTPKPKPAFSALTAGTGLRMGDTALVEPTPSVAAMLSTLNGVKAKKKTAGQLLFEW